MKKLVALLIAFTVLACGDTPIFSSESTITRYREEGFNMQWNSFTMIKAPPASRRIVLTVEIIVTNETNYPGAVGTYSSPNNVIRVWGKQVGNKVVVSEPVLGHEILHALAYFDDGFMSPDEFKANGL